MQTAFTHSRCLELKKREFLPQMTQGSKNLQEDRFKKKNDSTWPKLQSLSQEVEKNPGSFIVSHKKHRVYIGVSLRPPAPESAIIHYKPDWPGRWPQQSQNLPAPVLVALSTMSNGYTCKPPLSQSLHWPWPDAVWGVLESVNEVRDQTNEWSVRWPPCSFSIPGRTEAKWYHGAEESGIAWPISAYPSDHHTH